MRAFAALILFSLLSACSVLDQIALSGGSTLDPNRIYLGTSRIMLGAKDMDQYACVDGPLLCDKLGTSYECRCPNPF